MSRGSRRGLRIASGLAGAIAITSGLVALTPAESAPVPPRREVNTSDGVVKTQCRFTVTSVNYAAGTLRGRLTLHTRPVSYAAGKNVTHTDALCGLYSSYGLEFAAATSVSGSYSYKSTLVATTPVAIGYAVCTLTSWTGKNSTSGGAFGCDTP
ncbi:hypothetical protein [Aeromicrobium terrae]|uniref:Uncharacterized protein n=1 Tax=Aeromicrobium terrae TaxID=2498846 RepID=A0A5C8ND76_9ACTN|nr:hypothetical protein [Aeromicrobium terrae]TXL57577.1 hypothetical protein FHP06_12350 [Aeromicrobium terrae]